MDEPTIDCPCGAAGAVEVQVQVLDDWAEWRPMYHQTRCLVHGLDALRTELPRLRPHDRIVVMPL